MTLKPDKARLALEYCVLLHMAIAEVDEDDEVSCVTREALEGVRDYARGALVDKGAESEATELLGQVKTYQGLLAVPDDWYERRDALLAKLEGEANQP